MANISITQLPESKYSEISKALGEEAKAIKKLTKESDYNIALCIEGKNISSEEFAGKLKEISLLHSKINFFIGSSHGLSDEIKALSSFKLSFSKMTFPHQLFRVLLCEQIYRALSINNNSKYHK